MTTKDAVLIEINKKRIRIHTTTIFRTMLYAVAVGFCIILAKMYAGYGDTFASTICIIVAIVFSVACVAWLIFSRIALDGIESLKRVAESSDCDSALEYVVKVLKSM